MRNLVAGIVLCAVCFALVQSASAQDRERRGPRRGGEQYKEMIKKFDKDKDGKLNESERKAMMEAMILRRFDKNKDGKLTGDAKIAADKARAERAKRREAMMKKYDTNKDGKLDEEEMKKARAEWAKRRGSRGGDSDRPKRGGGKKPEKKSEK